MAADPGDSKNLAALAGEKQPALEGACFSAGAEGEMCGCARGVWVCEAQWQNRRSA